MKDMGKWIAPGVHKGDRMQYTAGRSGSRNSWAHNAVVVGGNHKRVRILLVDGPLAGEVKYVAPARLILRERWVNTPEGEVVLEKWSK